MKTFKQVPMFNSGVSIQIWSKSKYICSPQIGDVFYKQINNTKWMLPAPQKRFDPKKGKNYIFKDYENHAAPPKGGNIIYFYIYRYLKTRILKNLTCLHFQ